MRASRTPRSFLAALIAVGVLSAVGAAHARSVVAGGTSGVVPQARLAAVTDVVTRLQQANLGRWAYAAVYQSRGTKSFGGAMVVAAVNTGTVVPGAVASESSGGQPLSTQAAWVEAIGKHSIGFMAAVGPASMGSTSGYLRLGDKFVPYNWVDGSSSLSDMRTYRFSGTEATFMVNEQQMNAFLAFYYARHYKLFLNGKGETYSPNFEAHGPIIYGFNPKPPASCRYPGGQEGCAALSSSGAGSIWGNQFKKQYAGIKARAQAKLAALVAPEPGSYYYEQNLKAYEAQRSELQFIIDAAPNLPQVLLDFQKERGLSHQADPHALVRTHSIKADMVTVFGEVHEDPFTSLKWNRSNARYKSPGSGKVYRDRNKKGWIGAGFPYTIPDLAPGETMGGVAAERMRLDAFADALR
ncbi:MAG: hypothetical protein IT371_03890 [Deltaproteobacteria bacterium]|nr:hypothetical protein [Deltaproteobacteria bacterium]